MISRKFFISLFVCATVMMTALPMEQDPTGPWNPLDDLKGAPTLLHRSLIGHTEDVLSLKSWNHEDAFYVASGSCDKTVRIWNMQTLECIRVLQHKNFVASLCCLPSELSDYPDDMLILGGGGKFLEQGTDDFSIHAWSFNTGTCIGVLEGHTNNVSAICQVKKNIIASCSWDSTIRIWDLEKMECIQVLDASAVGNFLQIIARLDDDTLACADWRKGCIAAWDLKSGTCTRTLSCPSQQVICLQDMCNHQLLSWDYGCTVWDMRTGLKEYSFIKNPEDPASWGIQAMAPYGPNEVILAKINGDFWVYDYITGKEKHAIDVGIFGVSSLAVAGSQLVYATAGFSDGSGSILYISPNPFH